MESYFKMHDSQVWLSLGCSLSPRCRSLSQHVTLIPNSMSKVPRRVVGLPGRSHQVLPAQTQNVKKNYRWHHKRRFMYPNMQKEYHHQTTLEGYYLIPFGSSVHWGIVQHKLREFLPKLHEKSSRQRFFQQVTVHNWSGNQFSGLLPAFSLFL